jgi:hypothetical protein
MLHSVMKNYLYFDAVLIFASTLQTCPMARIGYFTFKVKAFGITFPVLHAALSICCHNKLQQQQNKGTITSYSSLTVVLRIIIILSNSLNISKRVELFFVHMTFIEQILL